MAGVVLPNGKNQFFASNGDLLASGKLYTYAPGTSTPKAAYTDAAASVAHANPIVLDSRGEAEIYWSGSYDVTLKTSADVTLWGPARLDQPEEFGAAAELETEFADSSSSSNGDAKVATKNTASGGTARTQHARNNEDFRSTDFDTLQAAVTAASGKVLRVIGSYSLGSTTISVPANTWLDCREASLTWSGNVTGLSFADGGGIIGGTLTGAGGATYNASGNAIYCYGTRNGATTAPTYVTGPQIIGVTITGWSNAGVWLGYQRNAVVRDCKITTVGYAGIGGVSCEDTTIVDNDIDGVAGSGASDWYGIFVDRSEGDETRDPRSRRVVIRGNRVANVTDWEAIDTHAGEDFVIDGNFVTGCRYGIMLVVSDISGTPSLGCKRVVVSNNTIQGSNNGACITVQGVAADRARNIVLIGNTLLNGGWANDTSEGAIRIYEALDVSVIGNTLRTPYVWGINLNGAIYGATVQGNTVIDARDNNYTDPAAIRIGVSTCIASIFGNHLVYQDSGAGTYVSVNSISIAGSLTGLDVDIGRQTFTGIDSTHLTYNAGTTTGVNSTGMMEQTGEGTLSGGTLAVTFAKRFPTTPKVIVSPNSAANAVRAHTISAAGFTAAGTGTDTFTWRATT